MVVVSDASPLIGLSRISELGLLGDLYETVLIPEAVLREWRVGMRRNGVELQVPNWVEVHRPSYIPHETPLLRSLDEGERAAIHLVGELSADLLIVDEASGRKAAKQMGIPVVGVLGVLRDAKLSGLIDAVRPLIELLEDQSNAYFGSKIKQEILTSVGE